MSDAMREKETTLDCKLDAGVPKGDQAARVVRGGASVEQCGHCGGEKCAAGQEAGRVGGLVLVSPSVLSCLPGFIRCSFSSPGCEHMSRAHIHKG